ncbi:hypothetical protein C7444_108141 [Sphaerotilus hippei]|uniref:MalT-like TPR region domain-containing protein n=1 Tax=Sphaerotilus hippei TaxID=744406 RepID=A0A318H055_9BURK|nr:hypothetical protein [Sphaerotilus hippei]PXW95882.1 hypothetical protein C7444_108141 [Sphaerotilus hippei]
MHRQLLNLEAAIAQARIPRELPFLRAERASVLARLGQVDEARAEVAGLRALPETPSNAVLNAWLWLTEGLVDYYECLNARARDRLRRAHALACSVKAPHIQALSAAWMAHCDFRAQDYPSMVEHADLALSQAAPDHHSARARACLVLACATHFAGREDLAQPWYSRARVHAAAEGDGATLSAVIYNISLLRLIEVRLADLFGTRDESAVRRVQLGMESSICLDQSLRIRALSHHTPMQRAQVLTISGDFATALALYDEHMAGALREGLTGTECLYQADRAWCLLQLGRSDEALAAARSADSTLMAVTEPEERVITHAVLHKVLSRLGLDALAAQHQQQADSGYRTFREASHRLQTLVVQARLERHLLRA